MKGNVIETGGVGNGVIGDMPNNIKKPSTYSTWSLLNRMNSIKPTI